MAVAQMEKTDSSQERPLSLFSRMSLLQLGLMVLVIGAIWRIADVFIFNLGDSWINIMPSKLGPLLILLAIFYRYRRNQFEETLGLSHHKIQMHIVVGFLVFLVMYLIVDIGASVLYASLLDSSYPLDFHVISAKLIWYSFIFFLVNAIFEETLFRGLLQNGLRNHLPVNKAVLASAIVFGIWHIIWPVANQASAGEAFGMLFISAFLGLLFGVYYEKFSSRKTLTGPIVAHTFVNFANESFKIGADPAVQGPDFSFMEPGLMMISLILLMVVFSSITYLLWRFRIENVEDKWKGVKQRFHWRRVN